MFSHVQVEQTTSEKLLRACEAPAHFPLDDRARIDCPIPRVLEQISLKSTELGSTTTWVGLGSKEVNLTLRAAVRRMRRRSEAVGRSMPSVMTRRMTSARASWMELASSSESSWLMPGSLNRRSLRLLTRDCS